MVEQLPGTAGRLMETRRPRAFILSGQQPIKEAAEKLGKWYLSIELNQG